MPVSSCRYQFLECITNRPLISELEIVPGSTVDMPQVAVGQDIYDLVFRTMSGRIYRNSESISGNAGDILKAWYVKRGVNGLQGLHIWPFLLGESDRFLEINNFVDFVPASSSSHELFASSPVTATVRQELAELQRIETSLKVTSFTINTTTNTIAVKFDHIFLLNPQVSGVTVRDNTIELQSNTSCIAQAVFREEIITGTSTSNNIPKGKIPWYEWQKIPEIISDALKGNPVEIFEHLNLKEIGNIEKKYFTKEFLKESVGAIDARIKHLNMVKSIIQEIASV
ncbi:MAG: hypothetical protein HYV24_07775 [Deltaproteobacteria bacterium]|nr:hypothetical protein [Deltaproteobacteria bacterium]